MAKRVLIVAIILVIGILDYGVLASKQGDCQRSSMKQDTLTISGRVFVGGHEPFTTLAIERDDETAVVINAEESLYKKLWSMQNKIITCKGFFKEDPLHGKSFYIIELITKE